MFESSQVLFIDFIFTEISPVPITVRNIESIDNSMGNGVHEHLTVKAIFFYAHFTISIFFQSILTVVENSCVKIFTIASFVYGVQTTIRMFLQSYSLGSLWMGQHVMVRG